MRVALLALVSCLSIVGCSGSKEPAPLPVPSLVSEPPSPEPSPSVLALPSPKETGVAGEVERAVLAYYAALNAATRSSTTVEYRKAFKPTCTSCESYADGLDAAFAKGQDLSGAITQIVSLRVIVDTADRGAADARVRVAPYTLRGPSGEAVDAFPATEGAANLFLSRGADGRWTVDSVVRAGS